MGLKFSYKSSKMLSFKKIINYGQFKQVHLIRWT